MKAMTCRQLDGACDLELQAETFEQLAKVSRDHVEEMVKQTDAAHLAAMGEMKKLMADPAAMSAWTATKRAEFDALPTT